jgi:diguanylate cyclase (GGDEF)-like protein
MRQRLVDWTNGALRRARSTLSIRMTLFFGGLFVAATLLSLAGTRTAIESYAEDTINQEMTAGSAVYERIATMQVHQLQQAGRVLSADFGFREAAATGDAPTILSALDSLRGRLDLDNAYFVAGDGTITGHGAGFTPKERGALLDALDAGSEQGVGRWHGQNHIIVASEVKAPMPIGWLIFARKLDNRELKSLAKLSALDLKPAIVPAAGLPTELRTAKAGSLPAIEHTVNGERMLIKASPVQSFIGGEPLVLVLEYSLSEAMADYMPILWAVLLFGALGLAMAVFGSWMLARRLARPIAALDAAAHMVSSGEHVEVAVETDDEIGRLAQSFNKMVNDIEARERQIAHMAFHDELTGLANRSLLREHMAQLLNRADGFSLLCLDLDNFKAVNDTLGHPTGDALLCEIAARLKEACPEGFVARLGGDEFAVVIDGHGASATARALLAAVARPISVNGHRIVTGTSIGISLTPLDGNDPVTLLKNADLALYRAKSDGKGEFRFFEAAMDADARKRREMEIDLHDALAHGELELYFQPLFSLSQNRVTAFEALMRWHHPKRGMVSPLEFIPLAEETGLILPIGEWALREACRIASAWPEHIRVAVNVSPVQFRSSALNRIIIQALTASGLAPERLELEITESLFIDNIEGTLNSLHSLRALGVRVALDDFGTGYSSLSYLRSFPFDKIKIDRSFIEDLLAHDGAKAIIRSITTLAEALGMETTAEGVENISQLDILREQGCNQIQGFYFSKPISSSEVTALIAARLDRTEAA